MPFTYAYPRPAVTVDLVLFTMQADDLAVLLVKRKGAPYRGAWALPGGFVEKDESLEAAAARELEEETGVRGVSLEQLGAFGDPGRDPRGHTITVAYVTFVVAAFHPVKAGDDAADVAWVPLANLAPGAGRKVAFDHARVIDVGRRALQARLHDPGRPTSFDLVPPRFTLTELQRVYEAILGHTVDKRNFRTRLLARDLVEPVSARRTGRHRPAQLYKWKTRR